MTDAQTAVMMIAMRAILLFLALLTAASSADAAERRFAVADFDRIIVEGPFAVRLTVGSATAASASGSQQALDAVSVEVQGTTLRIRRNRQTWGENPARIAEPAIVTLTTRALRSARIVGSGSLALSRLRGLRLELVVDGGGSISATELRADNLSVSLNGAGSFTLQGSALAFAALLRGTGSLDAAALTAETARIVAETAGNVSLTARRSADVNASGLGSVVIAGSPACTVRGAGAAGVRCGRQP